ncbi:MAG TPA: DNA-binding response regulator [Oscillibacter sp.]|nr:DNA-binding response regulator [Oscillibacter sp.]
MAMRKILIVEDQALARNYLCACVDKCTDCQVAGTLFRADAALQRCGEGAVDLILMDICTESDSDGLVAAESIKKIYPQIKIVMVTSMLEGRFLDRARKIGADSFWYKDSPSGDLVGVIEGTLAGKHFWPDSVPSVRLGNTLSCDLSDREIETLRLLCEGKTNAEIAEKLKVGESSVRTYINRMLEKTGYTNRNRLMIAAVGKRMVVPGCWIEEQEETR